MKKVLSALVIIALVFPLLLQSFVQLPIDAASQRKRIKRLESQYAAEEIRPVDEAQFFDGDLHDALAEGLRYDSLVYLATHNSYQTRSVSSYQRICNALSAFIPDLVPAGTGSLDQETLTDQLNVGIRSFEFDVEAAEIFGHTRFFCMHSPVIDMTTNCNDFELALQEIALWSDYNPQHLPITIIIEPKVKFVPMVGMRFFSLQYANALDYVLRSCLGDKLFTPADMLRDYPDFSAMRAADDWRLVGDMLGKVLVLFHYDWSEQGKIINAYMAQDASFCTQAMFPLHVDGSLQNACFLAYNDPQTVLDMEQYLTENHFIVRTCVDEHPYYSASRRAQAFGSKAQILSTDYPPRIREQPYTVEFSPGKTIKIIKKNSPAG